MFRLIGFACAGLAASAGCGPSPAADVDAGPPDARVYDIDASAEPETISQSGLYANTEAGVLAPGVRPYEPRFELWSDGAAKRRWIRLPEGAQIDNERGDFWEYPEGTRIWKEFSKNGIKVETRLLYKRSAEPGDWYMMSYVWNDAETDAIAAPAGDSDARGTGHAVPSQEDCVTCHEPMHDGALGFSAIQLDRDPAKSGDAWTLQDLLDEGRLAFAAGQSAYPHYPLPGDEAEQELLGYFHGNCAGCHNRRSPVLAGVATRPLFTLRTDEASRASVSAAPAYESTVGVPASNTAEAGALIAPGDPEDSAVYLRMGSRAPNLSMPPVGSSAVDDDAMSRVRAWIEGLQASAAQP